MMDIGLLVSIALVLAVPSVFVRPWPGAAVPSGVFDTSLGALAVGLAVGRFTAVALDDPGSLGRINDLLVIRSGVEFWPGVVAGLSWLTLQSRRDQVPVARRLAALAPAALIGWALYEATCLLRDGCPGPAAAIGLRPDGLTTRMFPVGLVVAVAAAAGAVLTHRIHRRGVRSSIVVVVAVGLVAAIRSVASIWLPHIGDGLTRQHRASLAVLAIAIVILVVLVATGRRDNTRLVPG